ncbi:malto-oligosyltrehalose synthase [Aurantimonas sp. MSK8Z-1]|uniref:malto-oligosyltrehalose synthase n=1 Tax=Mangrovibrevibacter kandeliae TaxID=2968473 RepID=UPI0021189639|nr:malto-oligosyltrehalose synthase [Aurantimonas sp. MSK8Z-1]MCW4113395.1 malto-oligosyltrehalose synthase [Aurantimonas sp. MSK8Z-1]
MNHPLVATYRLQFRSGTDFGSATHLAPYLKRLGVSHLYASPIFAAAPGSTHGYDVVDYNRFEDELGGESGFLKMSDALIENGVGLILDFVPNHMGVSSENAWWEDVLAWGADSRYRDVFDMSWMAEKILVPVLGKPYGDALRDGDLSVILDEARGTLRFDAAGYQLPLDPRTLGHVFGYLDHEERDRLLRRLAVATPWDQQELTERLAEHMEDESFRSALKAGVEAINRDHNALHLLHEAQHWRLAWWRTAREKLTYRRFFEITDLIGVRQERRRVFQDSHRTVIRLARERRLDGIRIDHVDGLGDPRAYLGDLKQAFHGVRRNLSIHVEKILTGPERLRRRWDIEGTTGYEFITALAGLYVDASREEAMTRAYTGFIGEEENLRAMIARQKREIFSHNLAGELLYLTNEAIAVASRGLSTRDLGPDTMARAIVEIATELPVYRTYVSVEGVPSEDHAVIDGVVERAKASRRIDADEPVDFIGRLLKLDFEDGLDVAGALDFTRRFQQTTGAVMAKAVEDTVFYRYNRLIALNEVGGEPDHYGGTVEDFHREMAVRLEDQPFGLLATSTHDTKRAEDARARLYTLSEAPERWEDIARRFARMLAPFRRELEEGLVSPDPASEWMFYQSLVGVLPPDFDPSDRTTRHELAGRLNAFMEKAVREAKRYTSWTSPSAPFEAPIRDFVEAVLDAGRSGDALATFWADIQPFVVAGVVNTLSQTLLKFTVPGVPDIYQGTEFYDHSLVDPDNRRDVDIEGRGRGIEDGSTLADALADWRDGRIKAKLTAAALKVRAAAPSLFTAGDYLPLEVEGAMAEHLVAFARLDAEGAAVVLAPRLVLALMGGAENPLPPPDAWQDTTVVLPDALRDLVFTDALTGRPMRASGRLVVREVLSVLPVALLTSGIGGDGAS